MSCCILSKNSFTSMTLIMWRRNSWASCCRFVENSGWPRPINDLNIWGRIPLGAYNTSQTLLLYHWGVTFQPFHLTHLTGNLPLSTRGPQEVKYGYVQWMFSSYMYFYMTNMISSFRKKAQNSLELIRDIFRLWLGEYDFTVFKLT